MNLRARIDPKLVKEVDEALAVYIERRDGLRLPMQDILELSRKKRPSKKSKGAQKDDVEDYGIFSLSY